MRMLNTFLQICIYLSLILIVFTLAINFISATGVFGSLDTGIETSGGSDDIFTQLTKPSSGMSAVWLTTIAGTGVASLGLAMWTRSTTPIGAYIFSAVFWTSYIRTLSVINITGIFNSEPMASFLTIGTVGVLFIWSGALVGIFTGGT